MSAPADVKSQLTDYLRELHLPAIRRCFEKARHAERETLSYEQYLLELAERECQERRENRIAGLLQESKLPLEKTLDNFDLKRIPQRVARQVKALLDGAFLDRKENVLAFGILGAERRTCCPLSARNLFAPAVKSHSPPVFAWCRTCCSPRKNCV